MHMQLLIKACILSNAELDNCKHNFGYKNKVQTQEVFLIPNMKLLIFLNFSKKNPRQLKTKIKAGIKAQFILLFVLFHLLNKFQGFYTTDCMQGRFQE